MLTEEQLRAIENRAKGVDVWYGGDDCEQVCRRDVPQLLAMVRELQLQNAALRSQFSSWTPGFQGIGSKESSDVE